MTRARVPRIVAAAAIALLILGSLLLTSSAALPEMAWAGSSTSVTVEVLRTLTVTSDVGDLSIAVNASGAAGTASRSVTLSVLTNAADGYTLSIWDRGMRNTTDPSVAIPPVSPGPQVGVDFPAVGFGFAAAVDAGSRDGATLADGLAGGKYVGYTTSPSAILTTSARTGNTPDVLTLTNRVAVDSSIPRGLYTDVVVFAITPNY